MENNIVVTQDMIDSFTATMREAYRVYGDDEERVHGVMDGIMCETLVLQKALKSLAKHRNGMRKEDSRWMNLKR